jgi:hypothetical protein
VRRPCPSMGDGEIVPRILSGPTPARAPRGISAVRPNRPRPADPRGRSPMAEPRHSPAPNGTGPAFVAHLGEMLEPAGDGRFRTLRARPETAPTPSTRVRGRWFGQGAGHHPPALLREADPLTASSGEYRSPVPPGPDPGLQRPRRSQAALDILRPGAVPPAWVMEQACGSPRLSSNRAIDPSHTPRGRSRRREAPRRNPVWVMSRTGVRRRVRGIAARRDVMHGARRAAPKPSARPSRVALRRQAGWRRGEIVSP